MAKHQTAAAKIKSAITGNPRRSVDASVRVDGHNDVAETRQTLCKVPISGVTRYRNKAVGTSAGKSVLNVNVKMLSRTSQTTASGVVAMQENQKGVKRVTKTCRPINARPKLRRKRVGNNRINCGRQF